MYSNVRRITGLPYCRHGHGGNIGVLPMKGFSFCFSPFDGSPLLAWRRAILILHLGHRS
jgi:hypothetical protein